jgi:DNA polymerase III subunit alpha
MKANHPEVFLAACMSLALGNTDRLAALKQEADRATIPILPPDINRSDADFKIERLPDGRLAIRYALAAVKKVGVAAIESLVAIRNGRDFVDVADFAARADPRQLNRMQLENMIRAGAFDRLEPNRARLCTGVDTILRRAQSLREEAESGQIGLFGGGGPEPLRFPEVPDWPVFDRLGFEAEAIGFHLTAHPLDAYAQVLRRIGVVQAVEIEARGQAGMTRVKLAGTIVAIKERITRAGNRMAWVRISDLSGSCEVTVFSEVLGRARDLVASGSNVLVSAELQMQADVLRITAHEVTALDQAAAGIGTSIRVWLEATEAVPHIRDLLGRESGGKGRVVLVPSLGHTQSVEIALAGGFHVTPRLTEALSIVPGVRRVEEI